MQLDTLYDAFMNEKRSYCTEKTVVYYHDCLGMFFDSGYAVHDTQELSKELFCNYLIYLRSKNIKNTSVRSYFRAVKAFCGWLYDNDYIEKNYCCRMKLPKEDAESKIPLSADDVALIDKSFNGIYALRNYCIFHLLLDCGLRCIEVERLRFQDIDFNKGFLRVLGKGSKVRLVPLPDFLSEKIKLYFDGRDLNYADRDFLFLDKRGDPISYDVIRDFIFKIKNKCGIRYLHAHLLRHTFATSYLIYGGNLEFLRILMGHSSIEVTTKYLHIMATCQILGSRLYQLDKRFYSFGFDNK